jgi:hypothetical protein
LYIEQLYGLYCLQHDIRAITEDKMGHVARMKGMGNVDYTKCNLTTRCKDGILETAILTRQSPVYCSNCFSKTNCNVRYIVGLLVGAASHVLTV